MCHFLLNPPPYLVMRNFIKVTFLGTYPPLPWRMVSLEEFASSSIQLSLLTVFSTIGLNTTFTRLWCVPANRGGPYI